MYAQALVLFPRARDTQCLLAIGVLVFTVVNTFGLIGTETACVWFRSDAKDAPPATIENEFWGVLSVVVVLIRRLG